MINSLKALADENRMKILAMLLNSDLCVGALAANLYISKPAVSQHLKILREAGLVKGEKRGYWTHYSVDKKAVLRIADDLNKLVETQSKFNHVCRRINESLPENDKNKETDMCQNCCQQPDQLKDKPEKCTPKQIRDCHGDTKKHPCSKDDCAPKDK